MVVGGDETALGFDNGHHRPPYYSSRDRPTKTNRSSPVN
jgi:hypothetical protein